MTFIQVVTEINTPGETLTETLVKNSTNVTEGITNKRAHIRTIKKKRKYESYIYLSINAGDIKEAPPWNGQQYISQEGLNNFNGTNPVLTSDDIDVWFV